MTEIAFTEHNVDLDSGRVTYLKGGEGRPILHLHMYGTSIEHLPNRIAFDVAAGTYGVYPAFPEILTAPGAGRRPPAGSA